MVIADFQLPIADCGHTYQQCLWITGQSAIGNRKPAMSSFGFFVISMLPATPTKLAKFKPVRRGFLVLCRYVIATFAVIALKHNVIAWHMSFPIGNLWSLLHYFRNRPDAYGTPPFANREPQPLLHRDRRDQLDVHRHVVARHHHLHS